MCRLKWPFDIWNSGGLSGCLPLLVASGTPKLRMKLEGHRGVHLSSPGLEFGDPRINDEVRGLQRGYTGYTGCPSGGVWLQRNVAWP